MGRSNKSRTMRRTFRSIFHLACMLLVMGTSRSASAQQSKPFPDGETDIRLGHVHVRWPSPESLIRDLRSEDEAVRLKALELLGLSPQQAQEEYGGQAFVGGVEEVE